MTLSLGHLKFVVVLLAAIALYILADVYHVPIGCVLLFTAIGALLAATWDRLTSITA